eukprot:m.112960 g.112960  ORF g.112960 m.112960 type:complete len:57 (-) comp12793_c0_seq4:72-242(-)
MNKLMCVLFETPFSSNVVSMFHFDEKAFFHWHGECDLVAVGLAFVAKQNINSKHMK